MHQQQVLHMEKCTENSRNIFMSWKCISHALQLHTCALSVHILAVNVWVDLQEPQVLKLSLQPHEGSCCAVKYCWGGGAKQLLVFETLW